MTEVRYVDSHTEGEPTRLVLAGGPDLRGESAAERARDLEARHMAFVRGVLRAPRGAPGLVGALCSPAGPGRAAELLFFNEAGALGMCGHGTIGVVESLSRLGRLPGREGSSDPLRFETPAGEVAASRMLDGRVAVTNVPSYRHAAGVATSTPSHGTLVGDVAYGGNWFFLTEHPVAQADMRALHALAEAIRAGLRAQGTTGEGGAAIDHVELVGPPARAGCDAKNYVLCPDGAHDRSPCGTGTSAKLACLAADGRLAPGEVWRQEGILGTWFEATYERAEGGGIEPTIRGRAHVVGEGVLRFEPDDPFATGIPDSGFSSA